MKKSLRRSDASAEERKLTRDLQRQKPQAIERVSARYGALLRGYLNETLSDSATAEDVLQLTLLEVWRRGPSYDPERASLVDLAADDRALDARSIICAGASPSPTIQTPCLRSLIARARTRPRH